MPRVALSLRSPVGASIFNWNCKVSFEALLSIDYLDVRGSNAPLLRPMASRAATVPLWHSAC